MTMTNKTLKLTTAILPLLVAGIFTTAVRADEARLAMELTNIDQTIAQGPFQPDWESLKAHQDPEWFRDAKFGIYTHWGPVTVGAEDGPAGGQWYGHSMYDTNSPTFKYHQKKFGDQHTVGYKDLIPKFTAEKFNANDWADLFAEAGALYAIALGVPANEVKIAALNLAAGKITSVGLLGSDEKLAWQQSANSLLIQPAKSWPCQHAVTFKIILQP